MAQRRLAITAVGAGLAAVWSWVARIAARTTAYCLQYRVTGLAAEGAFFAVLSLPPLIFGLAGTIGFIADRYDVAQVDVLKGRVLDLAAKAMTPGTVDQVIAPTLDDVLKGGRFDVVSIGFVLAMWSGSRALSVFIDTTSIMSGFRGERGIVYTRALSFLLYFVGLLIGIVVIPLVLAGPEVVRGLVPGRLDFLNHLYWPGVLVLSIGFMATLYHLAVPARKAWRSALPGALFTLVMWLAGSALVRWTIGFSKSGWSIYGPLAAPIALLLLLYTLWISALIGAALNAAIDADNTPD